MMERFRLLKIDTKLYVKGLSGALVFKAMYGILAVFGLFLVLYIGIGTFIAIGTCIPLIFTYLYRLNKIQRTLGAVGWEKKRIAKQLPKFIQIKNRICRKYFEDDKSY